MDVPSYSQAPLVMCVRVIEGRFLRAVPARATAAAASEWG